MSDPLRVAAVVEGPTDSVVLQAILEASLPGVEFEFQTLQPEESAAFGAPTSGSTGGGWRGVYRWSCQAVDEADGAVRDSVVFSNHDILIVHVDADVATKTYASGNIYDAPKDDLPCDRPCPPPSDTTDALRSVVLSWLGETSTPPRMVFCTPSMNMEAWVVASVLPENRLVRSASWECRADPGAQLGALPNASRFKKTRADYERNRQPIKDGWPHVATTLSEAARFQEELRGAT